MKPAPFAYAAPDSLDALLALAAEHGDEAKLLAGGQSLLPVLNFRLAQPAMLIDLNRLSDLDFVRETPQGGLRIGAMTRQGRLEREPAVARRSPLLAEALPLVAHPQIRNRGTLGGSLAHADPAAELPVAAVALDARLRLQRTGGERWLDAKEFFTGLLTTALEPGEVLVEVEIPPPPARTGWSFLEISRRHGDYAQAGVAARVSLDANGRCEVARLVYLSVGEVPLEARQAASLLESRGLSEESIAEAATLAAEQEIEPSGDIHASAAYKRHLVRVLTRRAVSAAAQRARGAGAVPA